MPYVRVDAAMLVILLLCLATDEALIRAVYSHNSVSQDFEALPSGFGPALSGEGLLGSLLEAEPAHACHPIRVAPPSNGSSAAFVALIRRHGCPFATKVLHAQRAGFQAAVVHNVDRQGLVTMMTEEEEAAQEVGIPAVFVSASASAQLKRIFYYDPTAYVILIPDCHWVSCWDPTDSRRSAWDLPKQASRYLPGRCRLFGSVHYLLLGFTATIWIVALYVLCYL